MLQSMKYRDSIERSLAGVPGFERLCGKRILITGAGGLIGSAIADILLFLNEKGYDIDIILAGRSAEKLRARFGESGYTYVAYDACDATFTADIGTVDYVIHAASNATPRLYVEEPIETMLGNVMGTKALLDYLCEQAGDATHVMQDAPCESGHRGRFLYVSSSEVYGALQQDSMEPHKENEYGYVDILNPRSSYPMGKRASEMLIAAYIAERGADAVIVRPGHVYGPTATKQDQRVSSAWPMDAVNGLNIEMKSTGEQRRSYVYCTDCAAAMLTVLLDGECGQAYNVANPDVQVSIYEMAVAIADAAGVQVSRVEPSEEERKQFNPMNNSTLDGNKLCELGMHFSFSMEEGARYTIDILREMQEYEGGLR